jgi:hypothetical protein
MKVKQEYVSFAAAQIPAEARSHAAALGIPTSLILVWLRQFGLPIVLQILQGLLTHAVPPAAPTAAPVPPA